MSDGRIATLSTLLFGRSGDALSHFVRIITNIIDLLNLMPNGYYQEHKTLVFEMTAVVCRIISTLGFVAVGYFEPTYRRTLRHHAVAILVFSWCLLITIIFGILNDTVPGQFRPIDSADCVVARKERQWYRAPYWVIVSTLLVNSIQDVWVLDPLSSPWPLLLR
ncbi:unnamed protein product [Clonostachys rosea f. rosea IK726]|uniref:Uncharacterized protein n=2 Tax=Bionectria ochroleuca TaxID=29856 RepID=A0A0B7K7I7_BIOOC|nr:unnamed protein product [Clonostachys rosea f. rosea IK726]